MLLFTRLSRLLARDSPDVARTTQAASSEFCESGSTLTRGINPLSPNYSGQVLSPFAVRSNVFFQCSFLFFFFFFFSRNEGEIGEYYFIYF